MKLCVGCSWYVEGRGTNQWDRHMCDRLEGVSLVDGNPVYLQCAEERDDFTKCGPMGVYWEAKEQGDV